MSTEQNGKQIVQQGANAIMQQISEQERKRKEMVQGTKNFGKQQAFNKVKKDIAPKGVNMFLSKAPKPLLKSMVKANEARAKALTGLSKFPLFKDNAIGKFFQRAASRATEVATKIQSHIGGKVAQGVATKAAAGALAAPTGGLSIAAEKAVTVAKGATDIVKATKDKKPANLVKGVTETKDPNKSKVDKVVETKATEVVDKFMPGANKMSGVMNKTNSKEDPNKDNNMAILSGTKDLVGKAGMDKGLDFLNK